jgi:hypothetical protein
MGSERISSSKDNVVSNWNDHKTGRRGRQEEIEGYSKRQTIIIIIIIRRRSRRRFFFFVCHQVFLL